MKKPIFLGTLMFLIILIAFMIFFWFVPDVNCSQSAPTIGWWKCDEGTGSTLADSAGNNNAITLYNGSWVTGDSDFGTCIQLTNHNGYGLTNLAGNGFNGATVLTVSIWIKIITANDSNPTIIWANNDSAPYESYRLTLYSDGDKLTSNFIDNGAAHDCSNANTYSWTLNVWHNIVDTYLQGGTHVLYVDGSLVKSVSAASMTGGLCSTTDKHIFNHSTPSYGLKNAYIAQVKIDGSQWTQTDVTNEWNTDYAPSSTYFLILKRTDLLADSFWDTGDIVLQIPEDKFTAWGTDELNTDVFLTTKVTGSTCCYTTCLMDGASIYRNREYQVYTASITAEMSCANFCNSLNKKALP